MLYILTLYNAVVFGGSGGWGTMHKMYCVWLKQITYAYIFTPVYIYAYQQINKKKVRYSAS